MQPLSRSRMRKAQRAGVEGLPGAEGEAVLDKLPVFGIDGALADFGAAVPLVIEQGMADGSHVDADLVGAARLQPTFHHRDEAEALQHLPVRDGPLSLLGVLVDAEAEAVIRVPADGAGDGAFVFGNIAPLLSCRFPR